MALNKVRIGDHVELIKIKCGIPNLTVNDVSGINRKKEFFEPSKQVGKNTSEYKIVPPDCFACNLMHVGRDVALPIAINRTSNNKIVSPAYTVFKFKVEEELLKDYFFIFLSSVEKDRFFWFHCDSSVRDGMDWSVFCNLTIEVPSIDIQKKYIKIYHGLLNNLNSFSIKIDDLKLATDAYLEELRRNIGTEPIGSYIEERKERNSSGEITKVLGISKNGFIPPKQDIGDITNYWKFYKEDFVYSPPRINVGSIGLYKNEDIAICSPIYVVFYVKDKEKLMSEYLDIWMHRKEFLRSTDFFSIASVRNNYSFDLLSKAEIAIPTIDIQQKIVCLYRMINIRKYYANIIKQRIYSICPILVRGSLNEAREG